jgi:PIN domain nuclease of toxin-antitoxin system
VKILLDTQVLLWAAAEPARLKPATRRLLQDDAQTLMFSAASIWEVAIKSSLGREDFSADPRVLRRALLDNGYEEIAISGAHAAAVLDLPPIHRDPFDRLLVAQSQVEGITLLTADPTVARYPGPIRRA